jgi:two-component system sensor histidine kinase KdpD
MLAMVKADVEAGGVKIPCGFHGAAVREAGSIVLLALDAGPCQAHLTAMNNMLSASPDRGLRGYAEALLLVAVSTLVGLVMAPRWGSAAVDLLYLPTVLGVAALSGLGPSLLAATASALAYNYFFTAPYRTFRMDNPEDIVTVLVLFLVAVVTSHLAASMRRQARLAEAHAARNATIAGFARQLLSCTSEKEIADVSVRELSALFDCNAILLAGQPEPHLISSEPGTIKLTPSDIGAAAQVIATATPVGRGITPVTTVEWQLYPVGAQGAVIAAVGLARDDGIPAVGADRMSLIASLLDQVALALGRARLESEARDFTALRERDGIRSTLLSTIGQDLTQPLAAIAGATRDLKRAGTSDKSSLSAIAAEVSKIQRYLANLLDLGQDTDDQPIQVGPVTIDLFRRTVSRDGASVHLTPKEYSVLAELAKHRGRVLSHTHLLRSAWGPAHEAQTEYLRVAIRGLRQKLESDPKQPKVIINEPAVGYRLAS